MKKSLSLVALVSLAAFAAGANAAPQNGGWIPAGEAIEPGNRVAPSTVSQTTRTAVELQVAEARRAGALKQAGEATGDSELHAEEARSSNLARASVKAATNDAIRRHAVIPAGEAPEYPMAVM